ncbi:unnamed protein product [Acanthoscelides obtectus]|uniref:E3 ubiquitin-protein ligase RNF180 n=1 Tax=Acanthoscelides obtectus TaxID=200917 RepID=A0A9P0LK56_ACAOB|nr:unnamed protein product [Acanthoscelides obtectus]CAK1675508.1 E3 ubiquitin-protein ligase RNF180 [Acanthoscelides obtectus]
MYSEVKCKKCRKTLFHLQQKNFLLNAHHENLSKNTSEMEDTCDTVRDENMVHLDENFLPHWISLKIEAEQWSKGRINCPYCDSRIGNFDFVSGSRCECSNSYLPPVHLIKSKIDLVS